MSAVISLAAAAERCANVRTSAATTEIWAGGSNSALTRRSLKAAQVLTLDDVPAALTGWRQRHGEPK